MIKIKVNVCCIQFLFDLGYFLMFGLVDYKVYVYDLCIIKLLLCILVSYQKVVSYVKFVDLVIFVFVFIDNMFKLWDLIRVNIVLYVQIGCLFIYIGYINEKVMLFVYDYICLFMFCLFLVFEIVL